MFKKISFWILIIFMVFGLFMQSGWAAEKVYNWNYHTGFDETYYNGGSWVQHWADLVWEETNHQLKINIFYNGSLGFKGPELMSSLKNGLLESCEFAAATNYVETKQPWWRFNDFYAMYDNWEQVMAVDKVAYPMLRQDILDYGGVIPLALFPCCPKDSFEGIWMNKEIKKWEDFRGTKIRIYFTLAREYCMDPLGFSTLYVPSTEIYQGLKTGLIDGAIQTPAAGFANHYNEIAKYFYAFEPITSSWWGILCSQKAFDALPKDVQEGLVRASKKQEKFLIEEVWPNQCNYCPGPGGLKSEIDVVKYFQEQGNIIVRVPLLQKKVQEQNLIGMKEWIAAEGGPKAQKLLDTLLEARELYPKLDVPLYESLDEWIIKE
ncbi:MAG TPA: TRAP transporter substrate-binding protein DctP [Atribacterota bacterium]|nr:TRAP transporter substrate-binding protein DctP [Atribacterota bacterium]